MTAMVSLPEVHHFSGAPEAVVDQTGDGRMPLFTDTQARLRLLVCPPPDGLDTAQAAFARSLAELLHGCIEILPAETPEKTLPTLARPYDLVLLGEKRPSWWQFVWGVSAGRQAARRMETSVLIMRRPRWPLREILFVCRAEASDWLALPWVEELAANGQTAVTLLVVTPCIPALYRLPGPEAIGLQTLLHPHTTSGQHVRALLGALAEAGVEARVRLRDGEPDEQIRQEGVGGLYDMIVIAGEEHGRLRRAIVGELVTPILSWLNTPLLLVKKRPSTGQDPRPK